MKQIDKIQMIKSEYIPLVEHFLNRDIDAETFVQRYLDTMTSDPTISPQPEIFQVLQAIFEDADAYWPDPDPKKWPFMIGEDELRQCCAENLKKLRQIVEAYRFS